MTSTTQGRASAPTMVVSNAIVRAPIEVPPVRSVLAHSRDHAPTGEGAVQRRAVLVDAVNGAGQTAQRFGRVGLRTQARVNDLRLRGVAYGKPFRLLRGRQFAEGEEREGVIGIVHDALALQFFVVGRVVDGEKVGGNNIHGLRRGRRVNVGYVDRRGGGVFLQKRLVLRVVADLLETLFQSGQRQFGEILRRVFDVLVVDRGRTFQLGLALAQLVEWSERAAVSLLQVEARGVSDGHVAALNVAADRSGRPGADDQLRRQF